MAMFATTKTGGLSKARLFWEALFSLHVSLLAVSMALQVSGASHSRWVQMEIQLNHLFHIRQTDLIRGYWMVWIPTAIAASVLWLLLRICSRSRTAQTFLGIPAGMITIIAPFIFWVLFFKERGWPLMWLGIGGVPEIFAILLLLFLSSSSKWRIPVWVGIASLAAHYLFWYFFPSSNPEAVSYLGPPGPGLGFCAAMAQFVYSRRLGGDQIGHPV
jgi:hypothetical protein